LRDRSGRREGKEGSDESGVFHGRAPTYESDDRSP
jgi:hypothetical protein